MNGVGNLVKPIGHTFKPSLQDISLKRFRMRYSNIDDCYYLHWDDAVCAPLAKMEGLKNGVSFIGGLQRYHSDTDGLVFVGRDNEAKKAQVSWKFDFSDCGLVVRQFRVKGRCSDDEDIEWRVIGDERVGCRPMLAATDDFIDIPEVYGCRVITVTAVMYPGEDKDPLQLLMDNEGTQGECPLDIKVDLMCPRSSEEGYVGEILLGIKWSPGAESTCKNPELPSDGQLQVYIVEGAGMVDEDTHKPFNAFIKCHLLPEGKREHTSPRQTAFPSWAKQFHFQHVEKEDLVYGGLEVLLCDSHLLYNSNIAGIRLCVPQKNARPSEDFKDGPLGSPILVSPALSRSYSPPSPLTSGSEPSDEGRNESPSHPLHNTRHSTPSPTFIRIPSPSERSKSLGAVKSGIHSKIAKMNAQSFNGPPQSPTTLPAFRRSLTPQPRSNSTPHALSPPVLRRSQSPSPGGSKSSPMSIAKSIFRLSGSHHRENSLTSPAPSPILGRRKFKGRHHHSDDSEFIYSWMEQATRTDISHWQQMLDMEGEWVYCWHALRPTLKPASA